MITEIKNGFHEEILLDEGLTLTRTHDAFYVPEVDPTYVTDPEVERIVEVTMKKTATKAANLLLTGPPSTGKSTLAQQIAARHGWHFFGINCATVRQVSDWAGVRELIGGETVFTESAFLQSLEHGNMVVFLDEINRTPPGNLNVLLPVLSEERRAYFEAARRLVRVHPNTVLIAAANIGAGYSGTQALDPALQDRFKTRVELGFPSDAEIARIVKARTKVNAPVTHKLVKTSNWLKSTYGIPFSLRLIQEAAENISHGMTFQDAVKCTLFGLLDRETVVKDASEWDTAIKYLEGLG